MASFFSTVAGVAVVDTRTRPGTITLPLTTQIPNRYLQFKDLYGTFGQSSLTISTQSGESFDDGTTTKILRDPFSFYSVYSASTSKWAQLTGTQTIQQTVSSLNVSSITIGTGVGWLQLPPIQTLALSTNTFTGDNITVNSTTSMYVSAQILYVSSIMGAVVGAGNLTTSNLTSTVGGLGQIYLSTGGGGGITTANLVSTTANLASAATQFVSALTVNALTVGSGAGWLQLPPIQTIYASTTILQGQALYSISSYFGNTSTATALQYTGLLGNYNNTVLAEVSTGGGTQEFLVFKGSSASDRVRVQTTGTFVVETGVSSRLWDGTTITTLSNATPAFVINTSSNVGIQTATPATALDVAGTGRFQQLSTLNINLSTINGQVYNAGGAINFVSAFTVSTGSLFASTLTTSSIFNTGTVCTNSLVVYGPSTLTVQGLSYFTNTISTYSLIAGSVGVQDTVTAIPAYIQVTNGSFLFNGQTGVTVSSLQSTTAGLIEVPELVSTVQGLGSAGYISTASGGSAFPSSISTIYGSSFNTFFLNASSMAQVNIRPTSCNMWVAVGNDATAANKVKYSYNGLNWSNSTGANFSGTAIGVAFNGSLWVVVGSDATNTIKYSGDGITWSNASGGFTSSGGTGVVWNGRIWVAVGNGTATTSVKYSGDGINWSNGAGGFTTAGYGVAWSGRMFVAVGDDTTAANRTKYSYDGINWSNGSGATFATTGTGVAYNGRMWVATGIDSGNGMVKYSFDGITWSNSSGATFQTNARGVAWNGRMWVAVGNDSTQCMKYSYDGITWSNSSGPNFVSGAGFGVVWNGSVWTVTGQDVTQNNTIKYSGDGINWSNSSGVGFTGWGWGIAYSSNTIPSYNQTNYEIESQNIPIYLRSTNQLAFLASTMIFNDTLVVDTTNRVGINTGFPQTDLDVAGIGRFQTLSSLALNVSSINGQGFGFPSTISTIYGSSFNTLLLTASTMSYVNILPTSNIWVAVGRDTTANIKYSSDGINWSNGVLTNFTTGGCNVVWNGNIWVAVGQDTTANNTIKYSGNGINWSNSSGTGFSSSGRGVAWNGRMFVAVGSDTTADIKYSYDGITWTNTAVNFGNYGFSVAWNGKMWVAVGSDSTTPANTIKYSYDGINWSNSAGTGFITDGNDVAWNGRMWVAVGQDTTACIKYSYNGINWSNASGGFSVTGNGVAWNGIMWVAVGQDAVTNNMIKYSYDGINWSNSVSGAFTSIGQKVSWNGTMWVAVGNSTPSAGRIKYSYDGLNWSNSVTGTFGTFGYGVAFGSNVIPSYNQLNFEIEPQNIPVFLRSTNQMFFTPSTMVLNNTLTIDTGNKVGININPAQTDLDVGGVGRFQTLSSVVLNTSQILVSSMNAAQMSVSSLTSAQLTLSSMNQVNIFQRNPLWVATGTDATAANMIKYSYDGFNWNNSIGTGFDTAGNGVVYNGNIWIAVGNDTQANNTIKYSSDGISWISSISGGFSSRGHNVAWNGRMFVAVGNDATANNRIKYSYDGLNWSNSAGASFSGSALGALGIAWNGNMWVALGTDATANNRIKYSYDGITWTNSSAAGATFSSNAYNAAWNGRMWVAVGQDTTANNTLKYSFDGITWSNSSGVGFTTRGVGVSWNGRMWVATGVDSASNNTIKYSYDGMNWSNSTGVGLTVGGCNAAWNGNVWILAGNSTTRNILYSYDGITWSNGGLVFSSAGNGIAFNSNVIPSYNQTNFEIQPQNIPVFLRSTNQMSFTQSTIIMNNTVFVDETNRVGINTGFPQTDLDVGGTGRFQILSTQTIFASSIVTPYIYIPQFITF